MPAVETPNVAKSPGRPPKPKPADPLDVPASAKLRKRLLLWGGQVAASRGIDLYDYLDAILAPVVSADYREHVENEARSLDILPPPTPRPGRKPKHD